MNHQAQHFFAARFLKFPGKFWILFSLVVPLHSCLSQPEPRVDANLLQSIRWYTGESGLVDDIKAKQLLELAAADNDALSLMWVARVHSTGRMGYAADKARAQRIADSVITDIEAMANSGVAEAQFLMGTSYAEALGHTQNDSLAADWYRRAAETGHTLAAHNMGNIYFSGTGVAQDDAMAVYWWEKAAQAGDAIPQLRLGEMFENGRGVQRNLEQARYWYQESARRGNANARAALRTLP